MVKNVEESRVLNEAKYSRIIKMTENCGISKTSNYYNEKSDSSESPYSSKRPEFSPFSDIRPGVFSAKNSRPRPKFGSMIDAPRVRTNPFNNNNHPQFSPFTDSRPHMSPFTDNRPKASPFTNGRPTMSPFVDKKPKVSPFTKKRPMVITPEINSRPTYSPAAKKIPIIYSTGSNRPRIQLP
jgi:hypothetical protein